MIAETERNALVALMRDDDAIGSRLVVTGWGVAAAAAFVLGFTSWQYAAPRPVTTEIARVETMLPEATDITGTVGVPARPGRVIGGDKITPLPLANNESIATSRDIDQLRAEIKELQRRIAQMGLSGEAVVRRLDRVEEKQAGDPAQTLARGAAPARPTAPTAAAEKSDRIPTDKIEAASLGADKSPERIPIPKPSPEPRVDTAAQRAAPPTPLADNDAEGPVTTGSVGKAARVVAPAAVTPAAPMTPPPVIAEEVAAKRSPVETPVQAAAPAPVPVPAPAPVQVARVQPVATPTAPANVAPGDQAALDLGGFRSLATLKRAWADMTTRYGDFSKGMEPLARLRETESGMEARLLAGPFANQTDAAKACMRLKAAGVGCSVTGYSGQALSLAK